MPFNIQIYAFSFTSINAGLPDPLTPLVENSTDSPALGISSKALRNSDTQAVGEQDERLGKAVSGIQEKVDTCDNPDLLIAALKCRSFG